MDLGDQTLCSLSQMDEDLNIVDIDTRQTGIVPEDGVGLV